MVGSLSVSPPCSVLINTDTVITHVEVNNIVARRISNLADKRRKHAASSRRAGHFFVPLELSGLGGLGQDALDLLHHMADAVALQSVGLDETWRHDQFVAFWVRRISIVMQQAAGRGTLSLGLLTRIGVAVRPVPLASVPRPRPRL